MKARQTAKIRELGDALIASGYVTLDQQAKALGLSRSTTWAIWRAEHKASGISAMLIYRMLHNPRLPSRVRARILEYVDEKSAGLYGHSEAQRVRFIARLTACDPSNKSRA